MSTYPASATLLAMITSSPRLQLWATCAFAIMKQFDPTVVSDSGRVPRCIVTPSRMRLLAPMRRKLLQSTKAEVLGFTAEDRAFVDSVGAAESRKTFDNNVRADIAALPDFGIRLDNCVGSDAHAGAEFSAGAMTAVGCIPMSAQY